MSMSMIVLLTETVVTKKKHRMTSAYFPTAFGGKGFIH